MWKAGKALDLEIWLIAGLRDVRGFAIKFYTEEGNWDLTGNNLPVSGSVSFMPSISKAM